MYSDILYGDCRGQACYIIDLGGLGCRGKDALDDEVS